MPFTSSRYEYALAHPAGWSVTEPPGTGGVHPGEPGLDTFDGQTGRILTVGVEPVGAGTAAPSWTCAINVHLTGEHALAVEGETVLAVGGESGSLRSYHLRIPPYVIHYLTVQVVGGSNGYTFSLESTLGRDDEDEALLRQILATVTFASK